MKTKEEILEKNCPSMHDLYLDDQGRAFRGRILTAMQTYADQQNKEANGKVARMAGDLHATQSMLIAAAEEIGEHWSAHCDAEGYGPANLMRRIEDGLQTLYPGYTMGEFKRLNERVAELEGALKEIAEWDDDLEDEWEDPGRRARHALNTIERDDA